MKASIICIGNRFVAGDEAGLLVFDRLQNRPEIPEGITVIEGGLAGLNLLSLLETGGRVVFVDAVKGFKGSSGVVIVEHEEILGSTSQLHFDHGAGLPYLLAVLPRVCDGELPEEIMLVGLEGECTSEMIEHAADISLTVAAHGLKGLT
ncbi:hydrogenase maturation protease [Desulfopila aestuarii]|uniref:Hydrogenase maturation protease n=1 Tax=Desulfopila aestuarii DSM 18488 TaxID=1121416 RepID=A0A1M7Y352_9BACT|nr:hydrogenase maturation protease [Desulfopila aestuarii]SHO46437.1 hydrogenase maturation protease [Desulfopila aestuarii DSM 18488]